MRAALARNTRSIFCQGSAARDHGRHMKLQPRNDKQRQYLQLLDKKEPYIVVATGSAGTGKTMLATHVGVSKLVENEVRKIVITRPAVSVDEAHGFLPGTLEKKMEPWIRPVIDILNLHFPMSKIESMMKERVIEICPLAFMRVERSIPHGLFVTRPKTPLSIKCSWC